MNLKIFPLRFLTKCRYYINERLFLCYFDLTLKDNEIKQTYERLQKISPEWTLFHEREFLENLLATRFNFFIAVFSLFLIAIAAVKSKTNTIIILSIGTLFLFCLWMTIFRIYTKLMVILTMLHHLGENHWFEIIRSEVKTLKPAISCNANAYIGVWIPLGCTLIFIAGIICVSCGWLSPLGT